MKADMHLLSAAAWSPHGLRWLPGDEQSNTILKFEEVVTLKPKLIEYLAAVIKDDGEALQEEVPQPPSKIQKTVPDDNIFGYVPRNVQFCWQRMFEKHLDCSEDLPQEMDPLEYWTSMPSVLSKVALQILALPASSALVSGESFLMLLKYQHLAEFSCLPCFSVASFCAKIDLAGLASCKLVRTNSATYHHLS